MKAQQLHKKIENEGINLINSYRPDWDPWYPSIDMIDAPLAILHAIYDKAEKMGLQNRQALIQICELIEEKENT